MNIAEDEVDIVPLAFALAKMLLSLAEIDPAKDLCRVEPGFDGR